MLKVPFIVLLAGSLLLIEIAKGMDEGEIPQEDWGGSQFPCEVTNWDVSDNITFDNIPIVDFAERYGRPIHYSGEITNQKIPLSYRYLDARWGNHEDKELERQSYKIQHLKNESNKEVEEWQRKRKEEWENYKKAAKSKERPDGKQKYNEVCISYLKKHWTYKVPKEIRDLIRKADGMIKDPNDRGWSLHLMSKLSGDKKPLRNRLYLEKSENQLIYRVLGANNGVIEGTLSLKVVDEALTLEILDALKPAILAETSRNGHIRERNIQEILEVILQDCEIQNILNRIYSTNPNLESLIPGGTYFWPTTTLKPYHMSSKKLTDENRAQGFILQNVKDFERAKHNLEKFLPNLNREIAILVKVEFSYVNEFLNKVKGFSKEQWKNWWYLKDIMQSTRESIKKSVDTNTTLPPLFTPFLSCPIKDRKFYGRTRTTNVQEVIVDLDLDECGQNRKEIYSKIRKIPGLNKIELKMDRDPLKAFHQLAWAKVLGELKAHPKFQIKIQKAKPEESPHQLQAIHLESNFPANLHMHILKKEYFESYKKYEELLIIQRNHLIDLSKEPVIRTLFFKYKTGLPVGLEFLMSEAYEEEQGQVGKIDEIDLRARGLKDQNLKIWKWNGGSRGSCREIDLLEGFLAANLSYNRLSGTSVLYQSTTLTALDISHSLIDTIEVGEDAAVTSYEKRGLRSLFCIQGLKKAWKFKGFPQYH